MPTPKHRTRRRKVDQGPTWTAQVWAYLSPRAFFGLILLIALLAGGVGGGQGFLPEHLLSLLGLLLMVWSLCRVQISDAPIDRGLWLVPALVMVLPLLQLIPLPPVLANALPYRSVLHTDLALSGVTWGWHPLSLNPAATERILWGSLVPVGLYLAVWQCDRLQQRWLAMAMLYFAVASALLGFWQLLAGPESVWYLYKVTNVGQAVGLFANRNHLASLLAALLPVSAGLLADRIRRKMDVSDPIVWALAVSMVILVLGVTATQSRAGFALLMLSVLATVAVLIGRGRGRLWFKRFKTWMQVVGLVGALAIIQYTLLGLLARLEQDPLDDIRWTLVSRTLSVAARFRGLGAGLGSFPEAYYHLGEVTADIPEVVNHAHNDYVELWLDGGVPAMLLVASMLSLIIYKVVVSIRNPAPARPVSRRVAIRDRAESPGLVMGAGFALLLFALHSLVDYPLRTMALSSVAAMLLAIVMKPAKRAAGKSSVDTAELTPAAPAVESSVS